MADKTDTTIFQDDSDDDEDDLLNDTTPIFKRGTKKEAKPTAKTALDRKPAARYTTMLGRFDSILVGTETTTLEPLSTVQIRRDLDNQFRSKNALEVVVVDQKKPVGQLLPAHGDLLEPFWSQLTTHVYLQGTVINCMDPYNIQLSVAVMHKSYRQMTAAETTTLVQSLHPTLSKLPGWTIGPSPPPKDINANINSENSHPNHRTVNDTTAMIPARVDLTSMDWEQQQQELDNMFEQILQEQLADLPDIAMPTQFARNIHLYDYQKQGIQWLYKQEQCDQEHPFFTKRNHMWECSITHCRQPQPPRPIQGSVLADDMGLGKTLQTLGLMLCNPPKNQKGYPYVRRGLSGNDIPRATLIVCPVSVMANWIIQINKHVNGRVKDKIFKVSRYHGPKRERLLPLIANNTTDVVITSYNTLSYDLKKFEEDQNKKLNSKKRKKGSELSIFDVAFHRIVLDEAHIIRSSTTGFFKATSRLVATHKLCLTGTPFVNKPSDLHSLLAFLDVEPMRYKAVFDRSVTERIKNRDDRGLSTLRACMAYIALRRNKAQVHSTIKLVQKTVENRVISFPTGVHQSIHEVLFTSARAVFVGFLRSQAKEGGDGDGIGQNYMAFLELILRVRQSCCHGGLVPKERRESAMQVVELIKQNGADIIDADIAEDLLAKLRGELEEEETAECAVCLNPLEEDSVLILRECKHIFCEPCLNQIRNQVCPMCRVPYSPDDMISKKEAEVAARSGAEDQSVQSNAQNNLKSSRKLGRSPKHQALLDTIDEMEHDEKGVIFSQWTSHLDLIEAELFRAGHTYTRIDGTMSAEARVQAMEIFETQRTDTMQTPRFILCSLMACGTGINLTRGSRVFMMDCWWNAAAENQAMDRVHRIGQSRPVHVYRFLMKDSIETRMMALQETKLMLGKGSMQKLRPEEKKKARMTTLHELFQVTDINELWNG